MKQDLRKAPIREQIYGIIKCNILNRRYEFGSRLSITAISKELNVSNTPVREALSMLERDGLIEIYPNAGPFVISFSRKRIETVAQAILSMLLGALELCQYTDRIDKLIPMLQNALKDQISYQDAESEQEYARYSIAFEGAFIQCCDNAYLSKQYREIEDLFYLTVMYDHWYIDTVRKRAVMEHQQILSAIMTGDFDMAKRLLKLHYDRFDEDRQEKDQERAQA